MTVTANLPFKDAPRISQGRFAAVLAEEGSPWASEAEALYQLIVGNGHDPAVWLAICGREHSFGTNQNSVLVRNNTHSWTNARSCRVPGMPHEIISDAVRGGPYVRYRSVEDSLIDGMYRVDETGYAYQQAGAVSIAEVLSIWTESEATQYIAYAVAKMNEWEEEGAGMVRTEYDHIFGEGFFYEDLRPVLPHEPSHGPNRKVPLDQKNLGVIWHYNGPPVREGDFDRQHILNVGHYHVYSANFSRDPNANLHQDKIAYHIAVDDHARAYLLRDLDDMSWHCGETAHNRRALAIYFPIGGDQHATAVQLAKGVDVSDRWFAWSGVDRKAGLKGHQEVSLTDCPGTLMPEIVRLRQSEAQLPPIEEAKMIFFEEQGYRITLGFMGHYLAHGAVESPEDPVTGGVAVFGYPRGDEYATPFGSAQEFERYFMEWWRDQEPPFDIIGTLRGEPDPVPA